VLHTLLRDFHFSPSKHDMDSPLREISLPAVLCVTVERRFGNLEIFLTFVMNELLRDQAAVHDQNKQRIVEERLRELGYL